MSSQLSEVLARNEIIWQELQKRGLKAGDSVAVDFKFYATKREEKEQIVPILQARGMKVDIKQTRVLIVFKGWQITATEEAPWTLELFQQRTREIFSEAEKIGILFEGLGVLMPQLTGQSSQRATSA